VCSETITIRYFVYSERCYNLGIQISERENIMKMVIWFIQLFFALVGLVATYAPLYLDYRGTDIWKIAWQHWAMVGATVLLLSLASIIFRLYMENHRFRSEEHRLQMEKLRREVKQLREKQYTMDTGKLI
jgi:hypothetical protein